MSESTASPGCVTSTTTDVAHTCAFLVDRPLTHAAKQQREDVDITASLLCCVDQWRVLDWKT
jgi:hypothetical protein